jgi:hypothetical protein
MSRLRIYPGDDGDAEREREAQWAALPPTWIPCHREGDITSGPNRSRTGVMFLHLRCNCRTRRDHGFDRCNRHITPLDNFRGYRYCIQCREHCDVTEETSWQATLQMRSNYLRMRGTPLPRADAVFYTRQIYRDGIRDAPQDCHCDCAGCLGPEPPPEAPVVTQEPPFKRVRRS